MILRMITFGCVVAGALALSQFPAFSQQYIQRLGGAVTELSRVVDAYDRDAAKVGLSRQDALVQQAASGSFGALRAANMAATFRRYDDLLASLTALERANAYQRVGMAYHFRDQDVARDAFAAFRPSLPVTAAGGVFAFLGAMLGWGAGRAISGVLVVLFRRAPFKQTGARH